MDRSTLPSQKHRGGAGGSEPEGEPVLGGTVRGRGAATWNQPVRPPVSGTPRSLLQLACTENAHASWNWAVVKDDQWKLEKEKRNGIRKTLTFECHQNGTC